MWTFHLVIIWFLPIFGNLSIFPHLGADTWFPLHVSMLPKQVQQILYTSCVCFFKLKRTFSFVSLSLYENSISCLGKHLSDFSLFVSHHPRIFSSFFFFWSASWSICSMPINWSCEEGGSRWTKLNLWLKRGDTVWQHLYPHRRSRCCVLWLP